MRFNRRNLRLVDCAHPGPDRDNELFVVEGDSAAGNVVRVRDAACQAVLPMQGKPLNAIRSTRERVLANPWFGALIGALGGGSGDRFSPQSLRYRRIMLLFDPDADGIHSGALMLMFFQRFMPALLEQQRIWMVRAPLLRITTPSLAAPIYAASEAHYEYLLGQLRARGIDDQQTLRYRGLGSLEQTLLIEHCVAPATRRADCMGPADAAMAIEVFGGRNALHDRRAARD